MNKKDSKKRSDKATTTIRSEFEKTSSEIVEEKENLKLSNSSNFFQKLKEKFSYSSNSSITADLLPFRSQFHHREKDSRFHSDVTFDGEKPLTSTPVTQRTRARAPTGYVDSSKIKTNRTYAPSAKKEETSESEEEKKDLKKRITNLYTKLRVNENSLLFAKGDTFNEKKVTKISKSRYAKDRILHNLYKSFVKNGGKANEFSSKKVVLTTLFKQEKSIREVICCTQ